jgi:hypothetical protein
MSEETSDRLVDGVVSSESREIIDSQTSSVHAYASTGNVLACRLFRRSRREPGSPLRSGHDPGICER